MSADNLWLIRKRNGKFYPSMEFASPIAEGNMPAEPKEDDISFPSWQLAVDWCDEQDRDDPMGMGGTEYGIFNEQTLDVLREMKNADRNAIDLEIKDIEKGLSQVSEKIEDLGGDQ